MNNIKLHAVLEEFKEITGMNFDSSTIQSEDLNFTIEQLQNICKSYKEKHDVTYFFQNLIQGHISTNNIYKEAASFHLPLEAPYALLLLETKHRLDDTISTILNHMFSDQNNIHLIPISDTQLVFLLPYSPEEPFHDQMNTICHIIVDTLNTEALIPIKISCGPPSENLKQLPASYQQAVLALHIGKRFHLEQFVFFYNQLGIDRLVYHIPNHVCEDFLNDVWKNEVPSELDSELVSLINCFLQNNLNIAETARQLHMHRNTLIYRIEKLEHQTNLDIRDFDDAMTLKLALMIMNNKY